MDLRTDKYRILLDKLFNGNATEEEIELLYNWMKNEETSKEFDSYCAYLWNNSFNQIPPQTEQEMWTVIRSKIGIVNKKKRIRFSSAFYKIASMILLPLFLCMGIYTFHIFNTEKERESDTYEVSVDKGQKASVILPDKTKAWINSATKLIYNYTRNERNVSLDGEAYFEIAKDPNKKFLIRCNGLNIEALGTALNVKGYGKDVAVSVVLIEGKIKVFNDVNSILLSPNQTISYNKQDNTFLRYEVEDISTVDFWRRNMLYFQSESLENIAKTIERMYDVTVRFEDEKLKDIPFSGTIRNSNLNNVLHIISLTYPIAYEINNDTVILRKRTQ